MRFLELIQTARLRKICCTLKIRDPLSQKDRGDWANAIVISLRVEIKAPSVLLQLKTVTKEDCRNFFEDFFEEEDLDMGKLRRATANELKQWTLEYWDAVS